MSQLPTYGGQVSKTVKSTTTRTVRVPGSKAVTRSTTVIADVTPCGSEANVRAGTQTIPRPGASGLRQPSGLRAPGGAQQAAGRPGTCSATTCGAAPRPPPKSTGLPQVRLQGLPRPPSGLPAPGQRPAIPQPRAGGLPQPQASGLQRPASVGLPRPQQVALPRPAQQPSGLQRPTPSGMQPPRQAGLQRPTPSGMQPPRQAGLQRPTPSGMQPPRQAGLQRPTPSGMQPPRQAGLQKPTPSGMQPPRPAGLQRPTPSGMQPPRPTGVSRMVTPQNLPRPTGLRAPGTTGRQMKPALEAPTSPVREPSPREPQIPPQTPAMVLPETFAPRAPQRPTDRPRGPEAYKKFIFDSKYQLKKPKATGLTPSPGKQKKRGESPEDRANRSLAEKSMARMGEKVTARAASMSPCAPKYIDTPEGTEMVLKETVFKTRVERDEEGEKIVKNLQIMDAQTGGMPKMIEMNLQQLDPRYALKEGKEVISIASKLSMSESYTTVTHDVSRAVTETVPEAAGMPTEEIAKLVEEENEDVDNTLKMLPPDLALSPGRYEMKRRLQHLQLNSESVALLEQSIIHPQPRADEAQTEPTPEVMAAMMHTVEKGVPPLSTPDQVFNTLFMETSNERYIKLSPVTEGPLQDVVVPTEVPLDVHKEVITDDMEKLTEKLQNIPTAAELPELDIFEQVMAQGNQITAKGGKNIAFQPITDEKSLWVNANLEHLVYVVGAVPVEVLDPANVDALEATGQLEAQMETGVEYYVDADPVQYMSRVQLRGTQLPSYFPGYLVALPEFPDVVKLASCPDEVFASAWKSAQPKYFPDESMQSMIF